jgi:methionyl-tRNA formyltransferase
VKVVATELELPVFQPKSLRRDTGPLAELAPDAVVVVAYGMILPAPVLQTPKLGCINVHFSLLPRWRGAAPVERAILAGDDVTGITTMLMDEGLDTGPMLHRLTERIRPEDTTGTLRGRLADLAPGLLVQTLEDLEAGRVEPEAQDDSAATLAPKIEPEEAALDPLRPAVELERRVRALDPAPGAFIWLRGQRLKVWRSAVEPGEGEPGTIAGVTSAGIAVQCSEGRLLLREIQPEGKRRMTADSFARGHRPQPGERIGASPP